MIRVLLLCLLLGGCASTRPATAWATFDRNGITGSGATGLADRARGRRLTIADPVRIASISKLVVALGVMRMVEAGTLDLDRDVSDYLGWRLRNPAFPDQPVTLRLLLSHRSSLKDDVDYAIPLGTSLQSVLANPAAFDAAHPPGTYFRYANLGFPVIASVMERASGERFDRLIRDLVLQPLRLEACFNWTTCSRAGLARAVVLYGANGEAIRDDLGGNPPACPVLAPAGCDLAPYVPGTNGALFSPQGGLRISVRDLTILGRLLLDHGGSFLSAASMRTLTASTWRYDGGNGETEGGFYCDYGLAVQRLPEGGPLCRDDLFAAEWVTIGHAGDAYGVRSGLWVDAENGIGIAYFATGNGDDPPRGRHSAYRAIEERLADRLNRVRRETERVQVRRERAAR
jgi:CubicO group peptidase (beta-lactamase class C family)